MTDEYGRIHTDGSRSGGQPVFITKKAHTMVLEVLAEWGLEPVTSTPQQLTVATTEALCRAVEQREILNAENQQLSYDLERQMTIANEHVNEVEALRQTQTDALKIAREALEFIAVFADVRSKDDSKTFAKVNRAALRTIDEKANAALEAELDKANDRD